MSHNRDSGLAKKWRARIRKTAAACHICGEPIDYSLPYRDERSFVIDHVIPLAKGGEDALSNVKAAHRRPRLQQQEAGADRRANSAAFRLAVIGA